MKKLFATACALLLVFSSPIMPSIRATEVRAESAANGKAELSEELRAFAEDKPHSGWSYHGEYSFSEVACEPSAFRAQVQDALKKADEQERASALQSVLSSYGFAAGEGSALYPYGMTSVELHGYGEILGPQGTGRITVVKLYGSGQNMYFVFLRKEGRWYLTNCLAMDYWAADSSYPYPELMQRGAGKPGAWLVTRSVGHGTGVYVDCRQWYNVFTQQFDITYTLEGFDSTVEADDWYYAGWKTELEVAPEDASDTLRFVTYAGMVRNPFDNSDSIGEEVYSSMTLHEYQYDQETASYISSQAKKQPLMNPGSVYASGYLRGR